jgi:hypothetical protein
MDFEMGEREDFGDWGDERFLGVCAEDWLEDTRMFWQERQRERELEEIKLEFADEANDEQGHERDLSDIVREQEEEEDWLDDADDYLNCDFEE